MWAGRTPARNNPALARRRAVGRAGRVEARGYGAAFPRGGSLGCTQEDREEEQTLHGWVSGGYWVIGRHWHYLTPGLGKSSDRWMNLQLVIHQF